MIRSSLEHYKPTRTFDPIDADITGEFVVIPKIWSRGSFHGKPGGAVICAPVWLFGSKLKDGSFESEDAGPSFAALWYRI